MGETTAIRFTAENLDECIEFCGGEYDYRNLAAGPPYGEVIYVGGQIAQPGDLIIKKDGGFILEKRPNAVFTVPAREPR